MGKKKRTGDRKKEKLEVKKTKIPSLGSETPGEEGYGKVMSPPR